MSDKESEYKRELYRKLAQAKAFGKETAAYDTKRMNKITMIGGQMTGPERMAQRINQRIATTGIVESIIKDRFTTQGASGGGAWSPLKQATIMQRKRLGFSAGPILIRSGRLFGGATEGKVAVTANTIIKSYKDGPAPRYKGKGRSTKSRAGKLLDYVASLNIFRSFFHNPMGGELSTLLKMRDALIAKVVKAILEGKSVSGALE